MAKKVPSPLSLAHLESMYDSIKLDSEYLITANVSQRYSLKDGTRKKVGSSDELVFNNNRTTYDQNKVELSLGKIHFADITQARKNVHHSEHVDSIAVMGLLETDDGYFVSGPRSMGFSEHSFYNSGSWIGLAPAGSATYTNKIKKGRLGDIVLDSMKNEFSEEIGGDAKVSYRFTGLVYVPKIEGLIPGQYGTKAVFHIKTEESLSEIVDRHEKSMKIFNTLKEDGMLMDASCLDLIRYSISEKGLPPDAWEVDPLGGIKVDDVAKQLQHGILPWYSFTAAAALLVYIKETTPEKIDTILPFLSTNNKK